MDEAILRWLSKRIYIPLPDENSRWKLFELKFRDITLDYGIDWDHVIKRTHLYNSDDITNVCREASLVPFTKKMNEIMNSTGDAID